MGTAFAAPGPSPGDGESSPRRARRRRNRSEPAPPRPFRWPLTGEERAIVEAAILRLGLSQTAVAKRLGVPQGTLSRWLSGQHAVDWPMRLALVATLHLPPAALGTDAYLELLKEGNVLGVEPDRRQPGARALPVYEWESVGDPRDERAAPTPIREEVPSTRVESLLHGRGFAIVMQGNGLLGRRRTVLPGAVCWVSPDRRPAPGRVVAARVKRDGEWLNILAVYGEDEHGRGYLYHEPARGQYVPLVDTPFEVLGSVVMVTHETTPG